VDIKSGRDATKSVWKKTGTKFRTFRCREEKKTEKTDQKLLHSEEKRGGGKRKAMNHCQASGTKRKGKTRNRRRAWSEVVSKGGNKDRGGSRGQERPKKGVKKVT